MLTGSHVATLLLLSLFKGREEELELAQLELLEPMQDNSHELFRDRFGGRWEYLEHL